MEWFIDNSVIIWLGLALILAAIEVVTTDLFFLMFAGGSLAAAVAAMADFPFPLQVVTGVFATLVLISLLRPRLVRKLRTSAQTTGTAALVGQQALVVEPVDAITGRIKLAGEIWSARLATDTGRAAEVGQPVRVVQISGATAIVTILSAETE